MVLVEFSGLLETGDHEFIRTAICSAVQLMSPVLHCLGVGIEKIGGWVYSGYRCH